MPREPALQAQSPDADAGDVREILRERLTMHFGLLRRTPFVQALISATYVLIGNGHVDERLLYAMAAAPACIEVVRALIATWVLRRLDRLDLRRTHGVFIVLAGIVGSLNGATAIALLPSAPTISQAYLVIAYFGVISAGVTPTSSSVAIHAAYSGGLLLAANVGWSITYPEYRELGWVFSLVIYAYTVLIALRSERLLSRSVTIRRERDRAVLDLERSQQVISDAMQRAESATTSRTRVLAAASHDLRQPMHALSIYSAVLAEKPSPRTLADVGQHIHQIVQSLGRLLDSLLDLSRLSTSQLVAETRPFALDAVVRTICAEQRPQAAAKDLALDEDLAAVTLNGDAAAVGRVVRHLLDNAIKFTPRGSVRIVLRAIGDDAVIAIEDTGIGIAEAEQTRVFEEFYQIGNPGRDRSRGVGLGLAIVRRLCELMDARIELRSRPGHGSRFEITMPGVIGDRVPPTAGSSATAAPATSAARAAAATSTATARTATAAAKVLAPRNATAAATSVPRVAVAWPARDAATPAAPMPPPGDARSVFRELLTLHVRMLRTGPLLHGCIIAAILLGCRPFVSPWLLYGWAAAYLAIEGLRAWAAVAAQRRIADVDPYRLHRLFIALAAVSGAIAGGSAPLLLPHLPMLNQALLISCLFMLMSGAGSVSSSTQAIYLAHTIALLLLIMTGWNHAYPEHTWLCIVNSIGYTGYMITVARDGERSLMRSLTIRRERDQLARDLERSNEAARDAVERAEQAAASRSRVLAAASHDLRQPIHALSIYSAILAENPSPLMLEEAGRNLQQIVQSLSGLLDELLDLSRLSSEHYVPELKLFRLDTVIDEVRAEYQTRAADKGLALRCETRPIKLFGDQTAIGRVVRNVLDNAIKYTDQGSVGIALNAVDDVAVLTIEDTGPGIDATEQARIFEEFYQIDNPRSDHVNGVGLGLAIVRRLCDLMYARLRLRSERGKGTCFEVAIPGVIDEQAETISRVLPTRTAPSSLNGRLLFVVDDEIDVRHSMRSLLTIWGADVRVADSADALQALLQTHGVPDLLITDLRLRSDEHGAAMATRLRERHGDFAVLIITGETSSAALREANQAGYPLLLKPIPAERLRHAIESLLPASAPAAAPDHRAGHGQADFR